MRKTFFQLGMICLFMLVAIGSSSSNYPSSSSSSSGSSYSSGSYGGTSSSSKRDITAYSVVMLNSGEWTAVPVSAVYDSSTNRITIGSNTSSPVAENSAYGSSRSDGAYAILSQYRYTTTGGYVFNL